MSWTDDTIFKRTETGEAEIRERALGLVKMEQIALVSVDGVSTLASLLAQYDVEGRKEFHQALTSLSKKDLIEPLAQLFMGNSRDAVDDEFFSSSMDSLESGSGLVVDTSSNSMRSMRAKVQAPADEVDLFIPLGDAGGAPKKSKSRVKKLVEVYPEPKPRKKKRRKKELPPENKWIMRTYLGLVGLGLLVVLGALLVR